MKNKLRIRSLAILATSPLVVISMTSNASAGSLEWAGSTTGLATGTNDDWDSATTANWSDGIGLVTWPAPGGTDDDAVFGGTAGTVTLTTVTANDIAFNTTAYTLSGGTLTLNGTTPTITNATGINAIISSVISGSSGLLKSGDGILTLSGSNDYSGTTVVNAGTLELSGNNSNASLQVNGAGALTRITGGTTTVASNLGDSYVTGGGTIEIDGGSLVINGASAWFSVGDHPSIPDGDGTLTLTSGSFTNNNSWGVVVGEGNAGAGFVNINGGVFTANDTFNNSGLMLGNGSGASGTLNLNGGTLITDQIKGGPGSGTVNFNGGKLQATGDVFDIFQNNGSITTTIQSGGLKVGGTPNFAISEELDGTGALTKEDGNAVVLSGNNSYSGGTTISGGTIVAINNSALGTGGLDMSGGTLQAGIGPSSTTTLGNNIQINGTGNVFNAPQFYNLALNGNMTGSGSVSVAGEWAVALGGNNSGFTGTWTSGSENPNNITRFTSADSGSAAAQWVLNGGRMVNNAGSNPTISLGSLSGTGGILSNDTGGQVTYSIGGLNTDTTFGGSIANEWGGGGTAAITKVGTGRLTLTGGGTYTGPTSVLGGTLEIDGSLGNTAVTVNSAALAGNGSIGGTVTLETGGNLAARIGDWTGAGGSGFEDLSVQSLVIQTGTPHVITVDTTGLVNFSESAATFPIILTSGGISGFNVLDFSVSAPGFPGTGTWAVQPNGTNLELVYSPASASAYDTWATAKGLTGANNAKGFDADDDGLTNLQEFAFDGNPLSGANDGKRVSVLADPDGAGPLTTALILTLPVRNTAVFNGPGDLISNPLDGLVYQIQGSVDLVDFTTMTISEVSPALDGGLPTLSTGWSYRSFLAPGPLGSREFIRTAVVDSP